MDIPISFAAELDRHRTVLGREEVLAELRRLTTIGSGRADRGWVLVRGGPGVGKSAILSAFLRDLQLEAGNAHSSGNRSHSGELYADRVIPHHFICRGTQDWDRPEVVASSLAAYLERGFSRQVIPEQEDGKLWRLLCRVSQQVLWPEQRRLILVIDGLDEVAMPADKDGRRRSPLAAFLPDPLPWGVFVVCASRPMHPYLAWLESRENLSVVDLDAFQWRDSNEAAAREFWKNERAAANPPLTDAFIDAAVRQGQGNLLYAVKLRDWVAGQPAARHPRRLPAGLNAWLVLMWEDMREASGQAYQHIAAALSVIAAARESLTLSEIGRVLGWREPGLYHSLLRHARHFLREEVRYARVQPREDGADGEPSYRPYHESMREFVAVTLGDSHRDAHALLARSVASWPSNRGAGEFERRYAAMHALHHRLAALDWNGARSLCVDLTHLEAMCRHTGVRALEDGLAAARDLLPVEAHRDDMAGIVNAVRLESHWLRAAPHEIGGLLHNRLLDLGWSRDRIEATLVPRPSGPRLLRPVRLGGDEIRTLRGHSEKVGSVALSADGRLVLSASQDQTLRVWNVEDGQERRLLATLDGSHNVVAMNAAGTRAVSGSNTGTLRQWDLAKGEELRTLIDGEDGISAVAMDPAGTRAVVGYYYGELELWDIQSGRKLHTFGGHCRAVHGIAVDATGTIAISGSLDRALVIWNLERGKCERLLPNQTDTVNAVAISADGILAASGSYDGTLRIWNVASGHEVRAIHAHSQPVQSIAMSTDGKRVVSGGWDQTLKVWDVESGRELRALKGHSGAIQTLALSADGRRVTSGSEDHTLKVWDLESPSRPRDHDGHDMDVCAVAVSAKGARAISGSRDGAVRGWDTADGTSVALAGHSKNVRAVAIDVKGICAASSSEKEIKVWNAKNGQQTRTMNGCATALAMSADGSLIAWTAGGSRLRVWNVKTGEVRSVDGHAVMVNALDMSADGSWAICGSDNGEVSVWDLRSDREERVFLGHKSGVLAVSITPDGRFAISSGSWDLTLKVWEVKSGRELRTLTGHTGKIEAVAISNDGRHAVSGSEDKTLRMWDLESGACLWTVYGAASFLATALAERLVVAGDALGNVWMLDLQEPRAARPVEAAAAGAGRLASERSGMPGVGGPLKRRPAGDQKLSETQVLARNLYDIIHDSWPPERVAMIRGWKGLFLAACKVVESNSELKADFQRRFRVDPKVPGTLKTAIESFAKACREAGRRKKFWKASLMREVSRSMVRHDGGERADEVDED